jgi:hypothetical protein
MATPEAYASQVVKLRAADWKCKLHRNNSGALPNPETGIPIRFGLGNISKKHTAQVKSSDEIGWTPVLITQEMVGKHIAVFTAFEIKIPSFNIKDEYRKGSREAAQLKFINIVKDAGGIAGFARSAEDVDHILTRYLKWLTKSFT